MKSAFEFLNRHRDGNLPNGEHEIDGRHVYAIVMDAGLRDDKDAIWESHRKYIDVQYLVKGAERMGWVHLDDVKDRVSMPYDASKDAALYQGTGTIFQVNPGEFAIFGPHDVHAPVLSANDCTKVRKIVIKVAVD